MEYESKVQAARLPSSLQNVRITALPQSAYYISEFITPEEEANLLDKIANAPKPRWKQLSYRRLQTWPSDLTNNTLLDAALPIWLQEPIVSRLRSIPMDTTSGKHAFQDSPHGQPNHVLINEYLSGQGIMPHKDGPAYFPMVCTISLGTALCLDLYETRSDGTRDTQAFAKILQEPRSLLITTDLLYTDYMHGITEQIEDKNLNSTTVANWDLLRSRDDLIEGCVLRKTRTSLTYRDVIKVASVKKFGIFGKR